MLYHAVEWYAGHRRDAEYVHVVRRRLLVIRAGRRWCKLTARRKAQRLSAKIEEIRNELLFLRDG
jgi:hypothetical protein